MTHTWMQRTPLWIGCSASIALTTCSVLNESVEAACAHTGAILGVLQTGVLVATWTGAMLGSKGTSS